MTMSICAVGEAFLGLLRFGRRDQPRQSPDLDREAVEALDEVACNAGGRAGWSGDQRDLPARHRRDEGGAQRDLGLAEADVAADQPVHRLACFEVVENVLDRAVLVVGLLIGKAIDELRDSCASGSATTPGRIARRAAVLINSPAISRIRSFIRDLRRCHASPPSRSSATPSLSLP